MSCGYGMTCILPNILSGSTSLYLLMKFCYIIYSGDYDYELWLQYDLYTSKPTQWFYFSILVNAVVIFTVGTMTMSCGYVMTCILPNILSGSTSLYLLMKFCYIIYSGDYDYELWLQYDLYTSKPTQWFYFSILVNAALLYLQW